MPSLKERRQALEADLQQLVGHINRTEGAMALLDELIGEEERRQQADVDAHWTAFEVEMMKKQKVEVSFEPAPAANDEPETLGVILSSRAQQPEMLPVTHDEEPATWTFAPGGGF